jgi:xanthine dehydrogenase accessory factor
MKNTILHALFSAIKSGEPAVLATITRGPETEIGKQILFKRSCAVVSENAVANDDAALVAQLQPQAQNLFGQERTEIVREGGREIFLESYCPLPKLVILGAVHIAIPLVTLAKALGFKVILIDPRRAFASPERFPHVDELIAKWPEAALAEAGIDASTCIVVLTHDPKLDDPAVKIALQHAPAYVGVLGSLKTHEKRVQRLRAEGLTPAQLASLHAPIGLDLGGRTPAEIALSIMAEIVAVRRGRTTNRQERIGL